VLIVLRGLLERGGGGMTRLEWVLRNREDSVEIRRRIVQTWCPSDYGLKNIDCTDSLSCEECWNLEVEKAEAAIRTAEVEGELKLFEVWQRRVQTMIKSKCAKLVNDAIAQNKDHIVMEDLSLFGKGFSNSNEFEGIKISRLGRLLNISNLKNIVASICSKKGVQLTIIPSHYTSQLCNKCGHISRENRKTQEKFVCENCGDSRNADFNASINIALIGEHEVHDHYLLKKSKPTNWYEPTFNTKGRIRTRLEDIVLTEAFQRSRLQLVTA